MDRRRGFFLTSSIFSAVVGYFSDIFAALKSVFVSMKAVVPYFFGMGELRKEVTEQYPDPVSSRTEDDLPPRTRGLLANDIDRCTGCGDCELVCPVECIHIETELGADASKTWVSVFDIDFSRCMFCGLCVEACRPGSLGHTRRFEGASTRLAGMMGAFGRGHVTSEQRDRWSKLRQAEEVE